MLTPRICRSRQLPPPKPVPFFFVNDTSVSATWYFNSTDPGVSGGSNVVPGGIFGERNSFYRAQGSIDHFDVWEYGTNLIHLELDQYGKKDPILGEPGAVGSREFFGFTRSTIGFNEITHSKAFSTFFTNDVGFEGGFTAGVQNNYLAEQTTQYLVGLNFDLKIPKPLGTMLVGVLARKEFTHNQFNACGPPGFGDAQGPAAGFGGGTCIGGGSFSGDRDFKWDWNVEIFNAVPLGSSWALGGSAAYHQHHERARPEGHRHFERKLPRDWLLRSPSLGSTTTKPRPRSSRTFG